MLFRLTQKQVGNGIGSIIASIGIPMILDAIRGKGVGRGGPRIGSPPFIGTWSSGRGGAHSPHPGHRGKKKRPKGKDYY